MSDVLEAARQEFENTADRILVAMSGGVDSAVAASRLVRAGQDVVGVTLHLWDYPDDGSVKGRCCAPEDQHDARRTADQLDFPHYAFDRRRDFQERIIKPFVDAYLEGITPSPCVECNRRIKLYELFRIADSLGAKKIATGHYARTIEDAEGRMWLHRAVDRHKDQSYFLHATPPALLRRLLLPLGDETKGEVREEAGKCGLPGAHKGESQELCFVPTGRYDAFVEERADGRIRPGKILGPEGDAVGQHGGIHKFTVGQRKGLGVALGFPAFVTGVDAASGTIQLGKAEDLLVSKVLLEDVVFHHDPPKTFRAQVQVRARGKALPAQVTLVGTGQAEVHFDPPARAVSVGQFGVAYDDTRVLGGGRIAQVQAASPQNEAPHVEIAPGKACDNNLHCPSIGDRESDTGAR